jgi:hypothetical protein
MRGNGWRAARRAAWTMATSTALLLVVRPTMWAQTNVEIRGTPACAGCRIETTRVVTLGRGDDPELPGAVSPVRDSRGFYYAASAVQSSVIKYDSLGRFVQTLGRAGSGPGEFRVVAKLAITPGDSLVVLEMGRMSLFSPTGQLARTVQTPARSVGSVVPTPEGRLIVATNDDDGLTPLRRILSTSGAALGAVGIEPAASCRECTYLALTLTQNGVGLWSAPPNQYTLTLLDRGTASIRARVAVSESPWHRAWTVRIRCERPNPSIIRLDEDRSGRLWVNATVAHSAWSRGECEPGGPMRIIGRVGDPKVTAAVDAELGTIIEVLDVQGRRVLASRRFESPRVYLMDNGLAFAQTVDADGFLRLDILRLTLVTP